MSAGSSSSVAVSSQYGPSDKHWLLATPLVGLILSGLELAAQDLAHGRLGHRLDEDVAPWTLEVGELVAGQAEPVEFLRGERGIAGHHKRADHLSPALIGQPAHGDVSHFGMLRENVLDLKWVDVLTARDQHIVHAPLHPQVALLIPDADVAGEVPPLADGFLRGIGALPVAMERFGRAKTHYHFSRHSWLDHFVGQRSEEHTSELQS